MSEYYIKIKQNNAEVEFSTSDKAEFNNKLAQLMQLSGALDVLPDKNTLSELSDLSVVEKPEEAQDETLEEVNEFDAILEEALKNVQEQEPSSMKNEDLLASMLKSDGVKNLYERLIITAGYLLEFEATESFTLKMINKKLFPILNETVGHSEIHSAISKQHIKISPRSEDGKTLTEYALTRRGEGYYNELK